MTAIVNLAFYEFFDLPDPDFYKEPLKAWCKQREMFGTILIAKEGINLMMSGSQSSIDELCLHLKGSFPITGKQFKFSLSKEHPHKRMLVKVKKQILPCPEESVQPQVKTGRHLTPQEFRKWLERDPKPILIDTRNDYEVSVGTFKGALDLKLDYFKNFGEKVRALPKDWRNQPVLTFCTGGIRCEKATAVMMNEGFQEVYQLDGGIIKYFEEEGGAHWSGSCFVFDWREALDVHLDPVPRSSGPDAVPAEDFGRHKKAKA